MNLHVKLFAVARQRLGRSEIPIELPEGATVRELRAALLRDYPPLAELLRHARLAVDNDYALDSAAISPTAEIALIPPVSGG
jgi:sulfur-carrier protein